MIDTLAISLNQNQFRLRETKNFDPGLLGPFNYIEHSKNTTATYRTNQSALVKKTAKENHDPILSLSKIPGGEHAGFCLRVYFSAPKFLLGNNFDELTESDLPKLCEKLITFLQQKNIKVTKDDLLKANVSAIHYSKNIPFTSGFTPYSLLQELSLVDLNKRLGITKTPFANGGSDLKFHSSTFELAFYDKIEEIRQAKTNLKSCEEKDFPTFSLPLLEKIRKAGPFEVVRMEARLNKRVRIRQELRRIGLSPDLTLKELFCKNISQSLLKYYWSEIEENHFNLAYPKGKYVDLFEELVLGEPHLGIAKALKLIGLKAALEEPAIKRVRSIIDTKGPGNWSRLKKEWLQNPLPNPSITMFNIIRQTLADFKPLHLVDFDKG